MENRDEEFNEVVNFFKAIVVIIARVFKFLWKHRYWIAFIVIFIVSIIVCIAQATELNYCMSMRHWHNTETACEEKIVLFKGALYFIFAEIIIFIVFLYARSLNKKTDISD